MFCEEQQPNDSSPEQYRMTCCTAKSLNVLVVGMQVKGTMQLAAVVDMIKRTGYRVPDPDNTSLPSDMGLSGRSVQTTTPAANHITLAVTGMTCASCSSKIQNHLHSLPFVEAAGEFLGNLFLLQS
jgi:hypothetical protein